VEDHVALRTRPDTNNWLLGIETFQFHMLSARREWALSILIIVVLERGPEFSSFQVNEHFRNLLNTSDVYDKCVLNDLNLCSIGNPNQTNVHDFPHLMPLG
jgi:hypothetical protein